MARESKTKKAERALRVLDALRKAYPDAKCALNWSTPLELLVATILSAQATDKHVNTVTPGLFAKYPTARAFARVSQEALENDIRSIGMFRNKARFIREACRKLEEDHDGDVPRSMEELTALPGVARKTANVVLGTAFGIAEGIVVDTHVARLAKRMGFVEKTEKSAVRIENALKALFPQKDWIFIGHALTTHGRRVCSARKPACHECPVASDCPKVDVPKPSPRNKR